MSTDFDGMIECRPWVRNRADDDENLQWHASIELWHLNLGNAHDALACLFGVRNHFGFRPLAEDRGLPADVSDGARKSFGECGGPEYTFGTTWIGWSELTAADWDGTDDSGTLTRRAVAGPGTHWAPVWDVMRTLAGLHGAEHVRLVVWFR
ncbi:hypothetical protein [Streptomyces wuyuanensis]|uniref:hypothetical protein n=1 Tax=Streptomyces wuyuanensis TaxID=1196353 RepID=UPI0037126389